jgi:hypothetical protein
LTLVCFQITVYRAVASCDSMLLFFINHLSACSLAVHCCQWGEVSLSLQWYPHPDLQVEVGCMSHSRLEHGSVLQVGKHEVRVREADDKQQQEL